MTDPVVPATEDMAAAIARLSRVVARLAEAPPHLLSEAARQEASELATRCRRRLFDLVFLGQFKRGKTTLLNSLIGRPVLPTGVLPLTAVITRVRWGDRPVAYVRRLDGAVEEVPRERLADYVTEPRNPANRKGVAEVEVFCPELALAPNICLVDTPGIGSFYEHNTQLAYRFVAQADAAVFVLSPESPLTTAELDFLSHVRRYVQKIFFVLNKADQVSANELEELTAFIRQVIAEHIGQAEVKLYRLSARRVLEAAERTFDDPDFAQFRRALEEFLEKHSAEVFLASIRAAFRRLLEAEHFRLELEQRGLHLTQEEFAKKMARLEQCWHQLGQRAAEVGHTLTGEAAAFEARLWESLQAWVEAELPAFRREVIGAALPGAVGSKQSLLRQCEQALAVSLQARMEQWQRRLEIMLAEEFQPWLVRFNQEAAALLAEVQRAAAEAFEASGSVQPLPESVALPEVVPTEADRLVNWGVGRWVMWLPRRYFQFALERRLAEAARVELSRVAGRLRDAYGDALEQSVRRYRQEFRQRIEAAQEAIRQVLRRIEQARHSNAGTRRQRERELAAAQTLLADAWRAAEQEVLPGSVEPPRSATSSTSSASGGSSAGEP